MRDDKTKPTIIILHGWGLHGSVYKDLIKLLKQKGYSVYSPDLPGFASEPLLNDSMVLTDYVMFLRNFIKKHKIKHPIIIGHSFGGRIALKYIYTYPFDTEKLILTGVPVIRHTSLKRKIAFLAAVAGGKVFKLLPNEIQEIMRKILYRSIGEWDYYKAGKLKQVFKNIIGEDIVKYAQSVQIPVFLVWGKDDYIVPATDMAKIQKLIPHASSAIVFDIGHKLPYLKPQEFFNTIEPFL